MILSGLRDRFFKKRVEEPSFPKELIELSYFRAIKSSPAVLALSESVTTQDTVQEIPNAERWRTSLEQNLAVRAALSFALKGKVLVDIGASKNWRSMYELAKDLKVSTYIGVDKYFEGGKGRGPFSVVDKVQEQGTLGLIVKGDALELLSHLEDGCCNVTANGIDNTIIWSELYHRKLALEIQRVVHKSGIAFGIISYPLSLLAINKNLSETAPFCEDPMRFAVSGTLTCAMPGSGNNPFWKDISPISYDRLLIRR